MVSLSPAPSISIGDDQQLCQDESTTLAVIPGGIYDAFRWSNGSAQDQIIVDQSGIYWIEANLGSCLIRDSAQIDIQSAPDLALADSLILCSGEERSF